MDLLPLDPAASEPPYEQLRRQIAARAASGELPSGTRLLTVRATAEQLDLAVNTVAKAYRALEADGVVVTEGRRGTFVAPGAAAGKDEARKAAETYVGVVRRLGLGLTDATLLVERSWSG